MNAIDEISRALGRLEEGMQQLKDNGDVAMLQRNEMNLRLTGIEGVSARVTELERRSKTMEGAISVHEQWRQRGIGIFMFIAAMAGIVGAIITIVIGKLWGK